MAETGGPEEIKVADLESGKRFKRPLFHRDGTLLLLAHSSVDDAVIGALTDSGIQTVYACTSAADAAELRESSGRRAVDFRAVADRGTSERNLYDEAGELVCARNMQLSDSILGELARRGEIRLFEGDPEYEKLREEYDESLARHVAQALESTDEAHVSLLRVKPGGEPCSASCCRPDPSERTMDGIEEERRCHALSLAATHGLLERVRRERRIDLLAAQDVAEEIMDRCCRDLPLALALADKPMHHDYLVDHALAVAIHAVATGVVIGYDRSQCSELALGGLLHDVGMTRVSESIIRKQGPLTPEEVAEIRNHPGAGIDLLKHAPGVSLALPFAVFQDHERSDGRGYPRGVANGYIHDYAKIIAVADVYQAMTAARPYKPRRSNHRAVLQLLRMVQDDMLDGGAVKAFLGTHGVYPIGSWVRLSDGSAARVVDARKESYDHPRVTVLVGPDGNTIDFPEPVDLYKRALASAEDEPHAQPEGRSPAVWIRPGSLFVAEAIDEGVHGFDFSAGFHLTPMVTEVVEEKKRETGLLHADGRRSVPTRFLDWSASFSGFLTDFNVLDLVQILDVSQKSGVMFFKFPDAIGEIRFSEGEILGAEYTTSEGEVLSDEEAIFLMMELPEGTFMFEQSSVERKKTVKSNNTMILMEGCRRQDERGRIPD